MKIRLLNSGGHPTDSGIKFPVIVEGTYAGSGFYMVMPDEVNRVGFTPVILPFDYLFICGTECELVGDENED